MIAGRTFRRKRKPSIKSQICNAIDKINQHFGHRTNQDGVQDYLNTKIENPPIYRHLPPGQRFTIKSTQRSLSGMEFPSVFMLQNYCIYNILLPPCLELEIH